MLYKVFSPLKYPGKVFNVLKSTVIKYIRCLQVLEAVRLTSKSRRKVKRVRELNECMMHSSRNMYMYMGYKIGRVKSRLFYMSGSV